MKARSTVPAYIAVPRNQEISRVGLQALLETNKNSYWLVGRPHTTPPDPQLFDRAYGVVILPTEKNMRQADTQFAEKRAAELNQSRKPRSERKDPRQKYPVKEVSILEQQLAEANKRCSSFKVTLATEKARAKELEERCQKLDDELEATTNELERVRQEKNNLCEALNPSGRIGELYDIVCRIATASCEEEKQHLLQLYQSTAKAEELQAEKTLLQSEKKGLQTAKNALQSEKIALQREIVALKHTLGIVHCRCLLEMISAEFVALHKAKKTPDCPWPLASEVRRDGVPFASSVADHAKAPCFDLAAAGFPELKPLHDLWKKLSQMVHTFAAGTVYIPIGSLSNAEEDLVSSVAAHLQLPTERVFLLQ